MKKNIAMTTNSKTSLIILAGGKGTRMKQEIPKVLSLIKNDTCLIENLLNNIKKIKYEHDISIIVGFKGENVIKKLGNDYSYIWQREQLGTGHAVQQAESELKGKYKNHLILYGDTPFISQKTIENILDIHQKKDSIFTILTLKLDNFTDLNSCYQRFGRIVRGENEELLKIVEFKDASEEEKKIKEVNPAIFCIKDEWLWKNLEKISNHNQQDEYYLTDLIALAHDQNIKINSAVSNDNLEFIGINTIDQLNLAQKINLSNGY
ncbi:NTP transferase domain-containing protein [bacterium]|nr:NTP transferase domain-containing protein [bacterium]